MLKASARVLRLLALLQVRREWPGAELCDRLGVGARTIRRDVDRLRQLGYTIDASAGPGGGYRIGAGSETPPLLLDDDEAVAVAVALGAAAGGADGGDDVALRVLAKLDQLLPRRLRRRLSALPAVTISLVNPRSVVKLSLLSAIAAACRDRMQIRFAYRDNQGKASTRLVEPMRLVHTGYRWYLAAWDLQREAWRTFRVDRIQAQPRLTLAARFVPRQPPEDFAVMVAKALRSVPMARRVRVRLQGRADTLRAKIPSWIGTVEHQDDSSAVMTVGGDSDEMVAALLIHAGVPFTLIEPPEMAQAIRDVAARLLNGVRRSDAQLPRAILCPHT